MIVNEDPMLTAPRAPRAGLFRLAGPCRPTPRGLFALLVTVVMVGAFWAPAAAQVAGAEAILENLEVVEEDGRRLVEVTLKDVLLLALRRSNTLKAARIGGQIAESRLTSARGRNHPTLTSKVETGRDINPFSSTFAGTNFLRIGRSNETTVSSAYEKKTDRGITYGLTFSETSEDSETLVIVSQGDSPTLDDTTTSRTITTSRLTGSVNVPIFQDYGRELDEIPVRQSEIGITRSRLELLRDKNRVLRTIAGIYWDLVDALEQIRVGKDSVRLSEKLLDDNRARLDAGVLAPADVAVSETQLARERQDLLEFQLAALRIEDQVRAALNLENPDLGYRPIDRPELRETEFDSKALLQKMFETNPQLGILQTSLETNRYETLQAENKELTDLDFDAFYVFNGFDSSTLGGVSGFTETDLGGYGASLTWTLPLFDHTTRETIRQKKLERSQIQLRVNDLRTDLSVQLNSVLRTLRLAEKEVETARVSMSLAKQLLSNEVERLKLGRSTSFRVSEFQQDASLARRREISARVRYEKSFLDMLILTGEIFDFFGLLEDT